MPNEMQPDTAEIVIHRGNARLLQVAREYVLPERFAATITPASPDLPICHLVIVVENGRPVCCDLRLQRRSGGPALSATLLHQIRLPEYVRQAVDAAAQWMLASDEPIARAELVWEDGERYPLPTERVDREHVAVPIGGMTRTPDYKAVMRAPRVGLVTDGLLCEVADVYRRAHARGQPPTRAVMDEWRVSRSTASRWVKRARDAGNLGLAQARVAGERP